MAAFNTPPQMPVGHDWQSAPKIVKGWAYPLSWLAIVFSVFAIIVVPFASDFSPGQKLGGMVFYAVLLALYGWLNRALKNGTPVGWTAQMILSLLGLPRG